MSNQRLTLKNNTKVFVDKKTNARTIAIPFRLPDGTQAVLMVSRLKDEDWQPNKIINNITINYENSTL